MRQTSTRRAPQREWRDRVIGSTRQLAPGACPDCERVISINRSGKRRYHRDTNGRMCPGSAIPVERVAVRFVLDELPPVVIGHERVQGSDRYALSGRETCEECGRFVPLNGDGRRRLHRIEADNPFVPYCPGGAVSDDAP